MSLSATGPWRRHLACNALIGVLLVLFGVSLLRHLSYPLLWNDESYGAVYATSILKHGYPKVHDDLGNMVLEPPDNYPIDQCYNPTYDIPTYISWGNEYFSTIGVWLATFTEDIYRKTALVRLPFALVGLAGILLLVIVIRPLFVSALHYRYTVAAFLALELLSVPLVLHLREARYYSVLILLQSGFIGLCLDFLLWRRLAPTSRRVWLTVLFFVTYQMNFLFCLIFYAVWVMVVCGNALPVGRPKATVGAVLRQHLPELLPVAVSLVLILPFELLLYRTYRTSANLAAMWRFTLPQYLASTGNNLAYFLTYEWLGLGLFFKIAFWDRCLRGRESQTDHGAFCRASLLFNGYFLVALLAISRNPKMYLRYLVPLQPVVILLIVVEGYWVLRWLFTSAEARRLTRWAVLGAVGLGALFHGGQQWPWIRGHVYELRHRYVGPLDCVIPYLKETIKKQGPLLIATNYESTSYIYYLNARVLIGYIPLQLEQDLKLTPDAMVFRRQWQSASITHFESYLAKAPYGMIRFAVRDAPVNQIPELYFWGQSLHHRFKTVLTDDPQEQLAMFVRLDLLDKARPAPRP